MTARKHAPQTHHSACRQHGPGTISCHWWNNFSPMIANGIASPKGATPPPPSPVGHPPSKLNTHTIYQLVAPDVKRRQDPHTLSLSCSRVTPYRQLHTHSNLHTTNSAHSPIRPVRLLPPHQLPQTNNHGCRMVGTAAAKRSHVRVEQRSLSTAAATGCVQGRCPPA